MNETLLYNRADKSPNFFSTFLTVLAWLLPATCLVWIPQNLMSLALGLWRLTGLELSTTATIYLQFGLLLLGLSWLSFLIVRSIVRFVFEPSATIGGNKKRTIGDGEKKNMAKAADYCCLIPDSCRCEGVTRWNATMNDFRPRAQRA